MLSGCPWKYVVYFSSTINASECEIGSTDEISEQNSSLIVLIDLPFDCLWEVVIETRKGVCRTNSTRSFTISEYYLDSTCYSIFQHKYYCHCLHMTLHN